MNDFTKLKVIETVRLTLSLIQLSDVDAVFETMNNENTANTITFLSWPITEEQAVNLCTKSVKGLEKQKDFWFLARNKHDNAPVGCICLLLSEDPTIGEIGYWVSGNKQGEGFATEMLRAMITLAFDHFSLSQLVATASTENPISVKVLEKQGFQIIGRKNLPTAKNTILACHFLSLINPK